LSNHPHYRSGAQEVRIQLYWGAFIQGRIAARCWRAQGGLTRSDVETLGAQQFEAIQPIPQAAPHLRELGLAIFLDGFCAGYWEQLDDGSTDLRSYRTRPEL
jgi:hypothetical protein